MQWFELTATVIPCHDQQSQVKKAYTKEWLLLSIKISDGVFEECSLLSSAVFFVYAHIQVKMGIIIKKHNSIMSKVS